VAVFRRNRAPRSPGDEAARPGPSLRARALRLLAMREHSRAELGRKLAAHAESDDALNRVLDHLQQAGHLSDERFVESLVQRRSSRYGRLRIGQELAGHGLDESKLSGVLSELAAGDRDRALAVWRKRYGSPPADLAEKSRQHRFLAQRGFEGETIAWVFRTVKGEQKEGGREKGEGGQAGAAVQRSDE
jgi:regulatory protein